MRAAAMKACEGRTDISEDTILKGLADGNEQVRYAARLVALRRGIMVPVIRRIEPPEKVYKKCLNNVIVVAHIPDDAEIRYNPRKKKCRANKAVILDIIGDFHGQKVGIAKHDLSTTYSVGDEIFIADFDMSDEECAPGFHFFCTKQDAEAYDWS